jgi:AcrR family transcriptional regulator
MARRPSPGARAALLEAARAEFTAHGLAGARVEDVARRAGLSKGAFYLHFRSKEEAFEELVRRLFGALKEQAARRQEAEDHFVREHRGAPGALVEQQIEFECAQDLETVESLWRNRFALPILDAAGPRYAGLLSGFRRGIHALVARRIADRQAAGWARPDLDPAVVADVVVGTYEGLARRLQGLRDDEKPDLAAWTRAFLRLLYEGLRVAPRHAVPATPAARRRPRGPSR